MEKSSRGSYKQLVRRFFSYTGCALLTFCIGGIGAKVLQHRQPVAPTPPVRSAFDAQANDPSPDCDRGPRLPIRIKTLLDRNFPGWRFHIVADEDCKWVKTSVGKYAYAQMIQGDFDGNVKLDYAVLIDQHAGTDDHALALPPTVYIVAFLTTDDGYVMRVITREGGGFLLLMPKGARDFDYDAQSEFTYSRDTIFSAMGMGGTSYLYENGKFRAVITSD
jgi:hypothetical protein